MAASAESAEGKHEHLAKAHANHKVSEAEKERLRKRLIIHVELVVAGMVIMFLLFKILEVSEVWSFPFSTLGAGSKELVDFLEDF